MQVGEHKGNRRALRWLLCAVLLVPICSFGLGGYLIWRNITAETWRDLDWRLNLAQENLSRIFEINALLLRRMDSLTHGLTDEQVSMQQSAIHTALADIALGIPRVHDLIVVGHDGQLLVSARVYPVPSVDLRDRDYFQATQTQEEAVISHRFIGRLDRTEAFSVARRRTGPTTGYAGLLAIVMPLQYFESAYTENQLTGSGMTVGLLNTDASWLVRIPPPDHYPAVSHIQPLISRFKDGRFTDVVSATDQHTVRGAYRRGGQPPVYLLAGVRNSTLYLRWADEFMSYVYFGVPLTVLLVVLVWIALQRDRAAQVAWQHAFAEQSRRQAIERTSFAAQKMEAVGRLAGGISHDFNNSLMVIMGQAELTMRNLDRAAKALPVILSAATNASRLIARLMILSRNVPAASTRINVNEELRRISIILQPALNGVIELRLDLPDQQFVLDVDPVEFEMAMLNLATNARDAMTARGGQIVLAVDRAQQPPRAAQFGWLAITMRDTGVGMSQEVMQHAFEPYYTTKSVGHGSGLGLAQVAGFARQSGGTVTIDSTIDVGTVITVVLPCAPPQIVAPTALKQCEVRLSAKVLVIEDHHAVMETISLMLVDLGCTVEAKTTTHAALVWLENGGQADVVLSDIQLPGGRTGLDLAADIDHRWPHLPVILMTGFSTQLANKSLLHASWPILRKPIERAALAQLIGALVRAKDDYAGRR